MTGMTAGIAIIAVAGIGSIVSSQNRFKPENLRGSPAILSNPLANPRDGTRLQHRCSLSFCN
jgi:hypothetical protein